MKLKNLYKKKGSNLEKRFKRRQDAYSLGNESFTTTLINQVFQAQTLPDTASVPDIRGKGRQL